MSKPIIVKKPPRHKCGVKGCKRVSVVWDRTDGADDRYCGEHWKEHFVPPKNKAVKSSRRRVVKKK